MSSSTTTKKKIVGIGGGRSDYPWKTGSFDLLKNSTEMEVRKISQKLDFYILHAVVEGGGVGGVGGISSGSPTSAVSRVFSSASFSPNTLASSSSRQFLLLTPNVILSDIVWLGKTLTNLLTVAEMQKPSSHESDHTKRTAFEAFMGLISHLNGVVQRLYVNYLDSSEMIANTIKTKKLIKENPELTTETQAFEIGDLARKSSLSMTASSFYLLLSQLFRGLTESPKMFEWLFGDFHLSSSHASSVHCGGGGYGGGTVYY